MVVVVLQRLSDFNYTLGETAPAGPSRKQTENKEWPLALRACFPHVRRSPALASASKTRLNAVEKASPASPDLPHSPPPTPCS